MTPSYKPINVPFHIISVFNEAFGEKLDGATIVIGKTELPTDANIWSALLSARNETVAEADDDEEPFFTNLTKIRWH